MGSRNSFSGMITCTDDFKISKENFGYGLSVCSSVKQEESMFIKLKTFDPRLVKMAGEMLKKGVRAFVRGSLKQEEFRDKKDLVLVMDDFEVIRNVEKRENLEEGIKVDVLPESALKF